MIVTRTPLRLSLGGGGTDHPTYFRRYGGLAVTATITPAVYLAATPSFSQDYICRYRRNERVTDPAELQHDLLRAVLMRHQLPPLELVSVADVPAGSGLGSSGAFLVGLLQLSAAWQGSPPRTAWALAREAAEIEIDVCGHRVGCMDQYACAFGGFRVFRFGPGDDVTVRFLRVSLDTIARLGRHLRLFYVGETHVADELLGDQHDRTLAEDPEMLVNLHRTGEIGESILRALEAGNLTRFAQLLDEHWEVKSRRSPGITSPRMEHLYALAKDHGALGGKLVGAGGGGFFLFMDRSLERTPDHLGGMLAREGLRELPFAFTSAGSEVLLRTPVREAA